MNSVSITFEIDCMIMSNKYYGFYNEKITSKKMTAIGNSLRQNGRLNGNDEFLSDEFGIIVLHDYRIKKGDIDGQLKIELNVSCENPIRRDNMEDIKEIIWTIMPACYNECDDESDRFNISMDDDRHKYWLVIADVPRNINFF